MKTSPVLSKFRTGFVIFALTFFSEHISAQGTFLFSNLADGVDAPITFIDYGETAGIPLTGPTYSAGIFLSSNPSYPPLDLLGQEYFSNGPEDAGYFFGSVIEVPGTNPGDTISLTVTAFDAASLGEYRLGHSVPFDVTLGGGGLPPATLVNMPSFDIVIIPEPSTLVLFIAGALIAFFKLPSPFPNRRRGV